MRRSPGYWLVAAILMLLPAGCGDPMTRPGTWHETGTIATNLAIAVVDKRDLVIGQPDGGADIQMATMAVDRLRHDKAKSLAAIATTTSVGGGTGASN
jgi:hypothetical protein